MEIGLNSFESLENVGIWFYSLVPFLSEVLVFNMVVLIFF